ncbi:MAG: sulfatase [Alphaproteobacteria bacterium]|nr:sulfatase [Alphaproteobacteria bacterium]
MRWSLSLLAGLVACGTPTPPAPAGGPPQTVVVLIGCTLRADRMSIYGNARETTPYLEALAAQGVVFERFHANAPWTRPAVAALTSGHYPLVTGIDAPKQSVRANRGLHPDFTTLAEAFSEAGWSTVGATANPNANAHFGLAQGFDEYYEATGLWRDDRRKFPGDAVVDEWLARAEGVEGPLYGQLLVVDTHGPTPKARRQRLAIEPMMLFSKNNVDGYDAAMRVFDEVVQRLDAGLADLGREDRLLVVVGDHGEGLELPKRAGIAHGRYVYDATVRVPWLMHGGGVAQGHHVGGVAEAVDLFPTLMELTGVPAPEGLHGDSRAAEARGERDETEETAVFTETFYAAEHRVRITTPEWTFIHTDPVTPKGNPRTELYKATDPMQATDVSTKNKARVAAFEAQREAWSAPLEAAQEIWEAGERSEEMDEQLRELGYIE